MAEIRMCAAQAGGGGWVAPVAILVTATCADHQASSGLYGRSLIGGPEHREESLIELHSYNIIQ